MSPTMSGAPVDPQRRAVLLNLKLRALVRDHLGHDIDVSANTVPAGFGHGAAIIVDAIAWILLDEQ
ncbi:MAG TPA: hypothetical protein VGM78_12915, partial [Ilumatobacteraceae bacterium]